MKTKEELKKEIKLVMRVTGLTQEKISLELGYSENYISEMLTPRGKVTDKFINVFSKEYKDILDNPTPIKVFRSAKNMASHAEERLIRIEAQLEVFELTIAGLLAEKDKDFAKKMAGLREAVKEATNTRLDKLKV